MQESSLSALKERIRAARGEIEADLVLKGGRVIDVFSGQIQEGDLAVHGGFIIGVGSGYRGNQEVDLQGGYLSPGLIDGHIHIESSMLLPSRLAASLVLHGTTTIVSDPHEIANVMGMAGVELMLQDSRAVPFDVFFMAPSCVPATTFETSGATLDAADLATLKNEPRILGLAEIMNFPGVLMGAEDVLKKLNLFAGRPIDGHAPFLRGKDLQAYVCAGIRSDHETLDRNEALEKLSSGMTIMIREGSTARNLEELLPLVSSYTSRRFCFVSDDLHPEDLLKRGHLEHILKKAVSRGMDPVVALQLVSLNPAEYFGLRDRGALAPGYLADLVVFNNLQDFVVNRVYKEGSLVVDGENLVEFPPWEDALSPSCPLLIPRLNPDRFRIHKGGREARVIEIVPGQIVTKTSREGMASHGEWVDADPHRDILKLAVLERHKGSGRIGLGLVRGFGLKKGALASSVAHDSHNVIAVGVTDEDLCLAVGEVKEMGGGMAVSAEGKLKARTPLEVGGLMSKGSLDALTNQLRELAKASAGLGCALESPFMVLSFLALPVIPELRLTDFGLVDVNRFDLVPLFF